ncbi:peptidylprolyl isomerase [Aliihoeflea aestuarii]|jgi:peptidyl-prolyl cis-trans isomerase C|uniref:peptidylprolyl isomerase n=1 Tax=Aliihoeflea aestuarii TaxID=453840 RepID=UPI0020962222|nr:peptidylprolyl isomerase [Aliihoeflea aestuarii]MCO6392555.1 peptidylprolyl isomerase [Aliihoeflea aestuarii]
MNSMIRRLSTAVALVALTTGASLAQDEAAPAVDPSAVVATINGEDVTEGDLELALQGLEQQFAQLSPEQRRAAALSALIEIRLLADRAEEEGLADGDEFQRQMTFLRERALHSAFIEQTIAAGVTDEEVRARYDQEIANAPTGEEVRARHIIVETEEEAQALIEQLDGGADFEELAREHSTDGAAAQGGDLGYFAQGQMVPEFEQAAFAMDAGAYSAEPIQTQFGWHVIKVEDKRQQQPPAFEQVGPQIRSVLLRERYFEAVEDIRAAADVEIADAELKATLDAMEAASQPGAASESDAESGAESPLETAPSDETTEPAQ